MLQGLTLVVTGAQPKGNAPDVVRWLIVGRIAGIPVSVVLWAILAVITVFVLSRTVFGRSLCGGEQPGGDLSLRHSHAAKPRFGVHHFLCGQRVGRHSSLRLRWTKLPEYGRALPTAGHRRGGCRRNEYPGWFGEFVGVIAGAIILVLLQNVLSLARVKYAGQLIIYGVAILAMLFIYGRQSSDRG